MVTQEDAVRPDLYKAHCVIRGRCGSSGMPISQQEVALILLQWHLNPQRLLSGWINSSTSLQKCCFISSFTQHLMDGRLAHSLSGDKDKPILFFWMSNSVIWFILTKSVWFLLKWTRCSSVESFTFKNCNFYAWIKSAFCIVCQTLCERYFPLKISCSLDEFAAPDCREVIHRSPPEYILLHSCNSATFLCIHWHPSCMFYMMNVRIRVWVKLFWIIGTACGWLA